MVFLFLFVNSELHCYTLISDQSTLQSVQLPPFS
jgi:hypothetical protein